MKKTIALILTLNLLVMPMGTWAQSPPPQNGGQTAEPSLPPDQLDSLVAPIALYPDPLIALILPASTVPTDIVMASRYLEANKDPNQIDSQYWDPSVKGLARYPDVVYMMNENLDWTNQLGAAVLAQQPDVMAAIQRQRAKADALGNLKTTPQQKVIVENQVIQVVPADPQVIYVPVYNPQVVYVEQAPPLAPLLTFGAGLAMGIWLSNDCDWNNRGIYVYNYGPGGWNGYYNRTNITINNNYYYWRPNNNRPRPRPPYNPSRPGENGGGLPPFRPPPNGWNGGNRPGGNGGGTWNPDKKPKPTRPGENGSGTWNPDNKPKPTRPGENGGGTWNPDNKPKPTRPGENGGGTWNPKPGGGGNSGGFNPGNRPGGNGGGTWNNGSKADGMFGGGDGGTYNNHSIPRNNKPAKAPWEGQEKPQRQNGFNGGNRNENKGANKEPRGNQNRGGGGLGKSREN